MPDTPGLDRISRWLIPACVAALTVTAFLPVFRAGWVYWDDDYFLVHNRHWQGLGWENVKWMATDVGGHWMPLTWLSLAVDHAVWGMDARGYHGTNVAVHGVNAVLVYGLIVVLVGVGGVWGRVGAGMGALAWGVHPLRVEAVGWVTERREVLYGMFLLMTVHAYVRWARGGGRRWVWMAVGAYAGSLMSKGLGITLPAMLVVVDVWVLGRGGGWRKLVAEKWAFWVLAVSGAVVVYVSTAAVTKIYGGEEYTVMHRVMEPGRRLWFYVWKTWWPVGLSPLYMFRVEEGAVSVWRVVGLVGAVGVTWWMWVSGRKGLLAAWVVFGIGLSPTLGLAGQAGPHYAADRYTYMPGVAWGVVCGAWAMGGAWRRWVGLAGVGVLGVMSHVQSGIWHDSMTLWSRAIQCDSGNFLAYNNRGVACRQRGDTEGAITDFTSALKIYPGYALARLNRANLLAERREFGAAHADLAMAMARSPEDPDVLGARASVWLQQGDTAKAMADVEKAIRVRPRSAILHHLRGATRHRAGDPRGALEDLDRALEIDPNLQVARVERGTLHRELGNFRGARDDYDLAILLDAGDPAAWINRALLRWDGTDVPGAFADIEQALRLRPRSAAARAARGGFLRVLGRVREALEDLDAAIAEDPALAQARCDRGLLRQQGGDSDGALADFGECLKLDGSMVLAYVGRAAIRRRQGDAKGATADLDEAVRRENTWSHARLARGCARLEEGRTEEALADFKEGAARDPASAPIRSYAGVALHMMGRSAEALVEFDEAVRLAPGWPDGYLNRASAKSAKGDAPGAAADLRKALEVAPAEWPSREAVKRMLAQFVEGRPGEGR